MMTSTLSCASMMCYSHRILSIWIVVLKCVIGSHGGFSTDTIPTYYLDPNVVTIFGARAACMRGSAANELSVLRQESASEYFRGHELYAHIFFVEQALQNPYRRKRIEDAEFEYIPLLPLHWRIASSPNCRFVMWFVVQQTWGIDTSFLHVSVWLLFVCLFVCSNIVKWNQLCAAHTRHSEVRCIWTRAQ